MIESNRSRLYKNNNKRLLLQYFVVPGTLVIVFLILAVPFLYQNSANLRLVKAFNTDEHFVVEAIKCMFARNTINVNQCVPYVLNWPRFLFYLDLGIVYPTLFIAQPTEQTFILVSRSVSALFGGLSVLATYVLGTRLFNPITGLLAGLLTIMTPIFLNMSLTIHPDIVQLFFILLALFFCYRLANCGKRHDLMMASVMAGIAFSSKLAGIFILPIIALACFLHLYYNNRPSHLTDWLILFRKLLVQGLLAAICFSIVFAALTPELLLNPDSVVVGFKNTLAGMTMKGTGRIMADGQADPVQWIKLMFSAGVMSFAMLLHLSLGVLVTFQLLRRKHLPHLRPGHAVIFAWPILFLGYLASTAAYVSPAHLVPAIPIVFIFGSYVLLFPFTTPRLSRYIWQWRLYGTVCMILLGSLIYFKGAQAYGFVSDLAQTRSHPITMTGEWLEQTYPSEVTILHDQYVYVPPKFKNVMGVWGITREHVALINPDLIITNSAHNWRYTLPGDFDEFRGGAEAYASLREFYKRLYAGLEEPYRNVRAFGPIDVYESRQTLGMTSSIQPLILEDDSVTFLSLELGQRTHFLLQGDFEYFEHERSLVLPGRERGRDAMYIIPGWQEQLVEAFQNKWGTIMDAFDIHDGEEVLKVFRLGAQNLPPTAAAEDLVTRPDFPLRLRYILNVDFLEGVRLIGFRVQSYTIGDTRPFRVTIGWQATSNQQRKDYTTFVHLKDANGSTVSQVDKRPVEGTYPTTKWAEGDLVFQRYVLIVPADMSSGEYHLEIGLYELETGERLKLVGSDSDTIITESFLLDMVK